MVAVRAPEATQTTPFQLTMLAELATAVGRAGTVEKIATVLADEVKWIIPHQRCTILLMDEGRRTWHLYPNGERPEAQGQRSALSGPLDLALRDNMSVVTEDALDAPAGGAPAGAFAPRARSLMVLPLSTDGPAFGTLNFSATQPGVYPQRPLAIHALLRLSVSTAVQDARYVAQLRQLNELKTRFVAGFTHDARNPLAVIAGFAELLLMRDADEGRRRVLDKILSEAQRLNELISDVLDLSRLALDGTTLLREPIDLGALIGACVEAVGERVAGAAGHRFEVDVAPGLPPVFGDPGRLRQALSNLIGNAVKYSPSGGEVRVAVAGQETEEWGREVHVRISDQGLGIDPRALPSLFQPFKRTPEAVASGIKGTGLGLVICRDVAEAHGGRLWAESPGVNQGSAFTLALPAGAPS